MEILKKSSNYYQEAIKNSSAISLIKYISIETYNRISLIKYSHKVYLDKGEIDKELEYIGIKEETLTQNIVYELCKFQLENDLQLFKLFESKNEKTNGSDILLTIKFQNGTIKFPFQAKLLTTYTNKKDGSYHHLQHDNSQGIQIDLLEKFAKDIGSGIGFYLFYNYTSGSNSISNGEKEEYYGCSFTNTALVRSSKGNAENKRVKFSELHPPSKPFYHFFGITPSLNETSINNPDGNPNFDDVDKFFKENGIDNYKNFDPPLRFYTEEEMNEENIKYWQDLNSNSKNYITNNIKKQNEFNPRYKIDVVSNPISINDEKEIENRGNLKVKDKALEVEFIV
ncbi:DUF6615 family protein [Flammeovirga sp. SJP92]|uniref:DUF6615 family protein n=1 Tax=Flammeovirga sp. SJP92 TaxID=1775430 RepID=UPI0007884B2B|nr:DUF6615 family protein [Flammeovirga sp. SJP92]KXX67412.1 hypothetical protein AVL50_26955 [Flammeovirga sp. SJP92]